VVIKNSDDKLTVGGNGTVTANHVVAVSDVIVGHAVASDLKGEDVIRRCKKRDERELFVIFDSFYRRAGGDFAGKRNGG